MLAKINSFASLGLLPVGVRVEVDIANRGFPTFTIVGLPSKAVEEAKERVRTAIINSGVDFPSRSKITVNLAPADFSKEGSCYDLPIALGILQAAGVISISPDYLSRAIFYGELSLDGALPYVRQAFLLAEYAMSQKLTDVFISRLSANEAVFLAGVNIYPVENLRSLLGHVTGIRPLTSLNFVPISTLLQSAAAEFDMQEIIGQQRAKRAAEIAAAGRHHIFFRGAPGAGKTMLARALPGIMPPLTEKEAIEVTKIHSASGDLGAGGSLVRSRPFRCPHHTTSRVGLIGGGSRVQPGEISLAHCGLLFLDELPEFPRQLIEALRQPLEDGEVTISRATTKVNYPCLFLLAAAANPCPCGYYGHPSHPCRCRLVDIENYRRRVSGPIMDRIDLCVELPPVEAAKITTTFTGQQWRGESSATIRNRVIAASDRQLYRFRRLGWNIITNGQMGTRQVKQCCSLGEAELSLMEKAAIAYQLSMRGYLKIVKIARTIADLAGAERIEKNHLAEALQFRFQEETL